jgi:hypothetical protein
MHHIHIHRARLRGADKQQSPQDDFLSYPHENSI